MLRDGYNTMFREYEDEYAAQFSQVYSQNNLNLNLQEKADQIMGMLNSPTQKQIKLRLKAENVGQADVELKLTAFQK